MTIKHWFKIAAGMLLVFILGLFGIRTFREAKSHVSNIADVAVIQSHSRHGSFPDLDIPVAGYAFRMKGKSVGEMVDLSLERSGDAQIDAYNFTVNLKDGFDVNEFKDCQLTPVNPAKIDAKSDFLCLSEGDAGYDDLEHFGYITFLPSGQRHYLMVPEGFAEAAHGDAQAAEVNATSGSGNLKITVGGKTLVNIVGNDGDGTVTVMNPATGEKLVEVKGDNHGGSVSVNGSKVVESKVVDGKGVDAKVKIDGKATGN